MTPEQQQQLYTFIDLVAQGVAAKLAAIAPQPAAHAGPKAVEVIRTEEDGTKKKQVTTLPELIAELSDNVRVQTLATEVLIQATNENAKALRKTVEALKQALE